MKIKIRSLALAAIALTGLESCGNKKEEVRLEQKAIKVGIVEIADTARHQELHYTGTVEAGNTVQLGFSVPGTVSAVLVEEGQFVKKGQLLATIDPTEYDAALLIATAGLEQAEDMFGRLSELYRKGSLPAKDFVDIKSKRTQALANRNLAEKRVKDTKLYAPMSGIVSLRAVAKGATAAPGAPAFTLIHTGKVYVRLSVPESEIGGISSGQAVRITVPTLQEEITGKVAIINPVADAVTKSYAVKVQLSNGAGKLLPGMLAEAQVATGRTRQVIRLPATAVVRDEDEITYVFTVTPENRAVRKRITATGLEGTDVVVGEGLRSGDRVVVAGQSRLRDGAAVSL